MRINYNGESMELTRDNSIIVRYINDLLNGVYIDVSDDDYAFISEHSGNFDTVEQELTNEGVGYFHQEDLADTDINYGEAPHLYIMNSVARLIVAEAERVCREVYDGE